MARKLPGKYDHMHRLRLWRDTMNSVDENPLAGDIASLIGAGHCNDQILFRQTGACFGTLMDFESISRSSAVGHNEF